MEEEIKKETSQKYRSLSKIFLAFFFVAALVLASFFGAVFGFLSSRSGDLILRKIGFLKKNVRENPEIVREQIIQEDSAVISVVEQATPAVVSIVISKEISRAQGLFSEPFGDDFFNYFFGERNGVGENGQESEKQTIGGGSGFLVSKDGMIVTNKHVVADSGAEYTVVVNDGKEYPAKVLAKDPMNDIAVIKIEGSDFPTLDLGDSDQLKIGQTVIAIGNSLGEFSNTVSRGIVSGLKRNITAGSDFGQAERLNNIIQTDAAINSGNSGGPLLDISGKVVGVNVAVAQGAENIGFALPTNQIRRAVEQVRTSGKITAPYLGVRYIPISKEIQKENNLPFSYGVLVLRGERMTDFAVIPGSPADKAGLVENDIILEVDGVKIDEKTTLSEMINRKNVGDEVVLKIWHKGQEKELRAKLEEKR
ncbi:MAG: S1C family serine protease [Patescibacteria group bacterium]